MSATTNFASTPTTGGVKLTTADTSRTVPAGGGSQLWKPAANLGGLVERLVITPLATTVQSVVRFFRYDGTTAKLLYEVNLPPMTVTGSAPVQPIVLSAVYYPELFPIACQAAEWLTCTVNDAQTGIEVHAEGGAF